MDEEQPERRWIDVVVRLDSDDPPAGMFWRIGAATPRSFAGWLDLLQSLSDLLHEEDSEDDRFRQPGRT